MDKNLSNSSSLRGSFKYGMKAKLNELPKIDAIVVGSVAVSTTGSRIGKSGGYGDLEYAILRELNFINESVPVATTVHKIQIISDIPVEKHDVPVDYIVTPNRVIITKTKYPKPKGVVWNHISRKMLDEIPLLKVISKGKNLES